VNVVCVCIFNRRQDEELDALSASVQRIGGVSLTIHEELVGQVPSNIIRKILYFGKDRWGDSGELKPFL
jgi:hypothetical protein